MKHPPKPKTKIVHRKLGRERSWGLAEPAIDKIQLDSRLKGYRYLLYAIHEKLHIMFPMWSETKIHKQASVLARFVWHLKFRKVED
jgi:hypothetical protein